MRSKKKKTYSFKDHPEHKEQLSSYSQKWIDNALSTKAITAEDREQCVEAVIGLYEAADLKPPPKERIIFVPSPFVARVASGLASAIWYSRKNGQKERSVTAATRAATYAATVAATRDATDAATDAATWEATEDATYVATYAATRTATVAATEAATMDATKAATMDATNEATSAATDAATMDATYAATRTATDAATNAATEAATRDATEAATWDATWDATEAATWAATSAATSAATEDATRAATRAATNAATWDATRNATHAVITVNPNAYYTFNPQIIKTLSEIFRVGELGVRYCQQAWRLWNGGNQWSGRASYIGFFKDVAKLDLDYSKYDHYEILATRAGPRFMHEEFCIISDRPEKLTVNESNQPHNESGPFCQWRDGSAIYALNGVYMPRWLFETPKDQIDPKDILKIDNVEIRREAIKWYGLEHLLNYMNYKVLDTRDDYNYAVIQLELGGENNETGTFLKMDNPSVPGEIHVEGVGDHVTTVAEALADRWPKNMLDKYGYKEAAERA